MEKVIRKLIVMIIAVMVTIPVVTSSAAAASTVSISGGDNVTGGEIFTMTVTFDGDSIGRVVGDITYDTEMLSYISGGSSSGNVGYVELKKAGTGEALVFDLKFQAISEGSTQIDVSASEMYTLDEEYMDTPSTSKTVIIAGDAEDEDIIKETAAEDDNAADEALSVDEKNDLDSIEIETSMPEEETMNTVTDTETVIDQQENNSMSIAKGIFIGIITLVLILIVAAVLRRRNRN